MSSQIPQFGAGTNRKLWGLFLFGLGVFLLVMNHWLATDKGQVYFMVVLFGPTFCLLGLGTLFDERILSAAIASEAATVPLGPKVVATLLVAVGLVISFWLFFSIYKVR